MEAQKYKKNYQEIQILELKQSKLVHMEREYLFESKKKGWSYYICINFHKKNIKCPSKIRIHSYEVYKGEIMKGHNEKCQIVSGSESPNPKNEIYSNNVCFFN